MRFSDKTRKKETQNSIEALRALSEMLGVVSSFCASELEAKRAKNPTCQKYLWLFVSPKVVQFEEAILDQIELLEMEQVALGDLPKARKNAHRKT